MKPAPHHAPTLAPLAAFLVGLLAVRLAVPLVLYLITLWMAWRWFGVLGPPDFAQLLKAGLGWEAGPPNSWALSAAVLLIAAGTALAWLGHVARAAGKGPSRRLVTDGIYARLRHPQVSGCILIMLGVFAASPEWVGAVLFAVFAAFYIGWALIEERSLARSHGAAWQRYAQRTPAFLPRRRGQGQSGNGSA